MESRFLALPLEAKLVTPGAAQGRVKLHGVYHADDPYAVRLALYPHGVSWIFGRDLVAESIQRFAEIGEGQVKVRPYGPDHFDISLTASGKTAVLRFAEDALIGFLAETEELVPRGQEQMPDTWLPQLTA